MRKRSGYLIAAGFILLICLGIFETFSMIPDADSFSKCVRKENGGWYAVSGTEKEQRIYQMTENGRIVQISEEIKGGTLAPLAVSEDGENLFCLFGYEERGNRYYRFRTYNKELEVTDQTERQKITGEIQESMQVEGKNAVVTTLSADRKTAGIYELNLSKKNASFKETETVSAPEKRFFVRAVKIGDVFYAQYDNGLTVSVKDAEQKEEPEFPASLEEEEFDSSIKVSGALAVLRYEGMRVFAGTLLKWAAVVFLLFLIYGLTGRTSYRLRRFAAQELLLLSSLLVFCGISIHFLNNQDKESCKERTEYRLQSMREQMETYLQAVQLGENYTDTAEYENAYSAMLDTKNSERWESTPVSVRLAKNERKDYQVIMADTETAESLFTGEEKEREALRQAEGKNTAVCVLEQFQDEYRLWCAAPAGTGIVQNSYWSLQISAKKSESAVKTIRGLFLFSVAAAAAGTVILLILLYIEGNQIRRLVEAFKTSAQGEYKKEKRPIRLNTEMETLWNGLDDYMKGTERIQYRLTSQQKLYARFIPKAIEVLSPVWTPERLQAGEHISACGIVGCISTDGDERWTNDRQAAMMNRIMDVLFRIQEKDQVAFVPQSGDLKKIWGLFLNGEDSAVQTSIRLLGDVENMSILVHKSSYTYGIAGNESQVTPYFSVEAGDELMYYTEKLRSLHVKAAITEKTAGDFENTVSMRCIGYIAISGVNRNLYEVLEAYPSSQRYAMEAQITKFTKALELYYGSDFYLARNIFAEVLRECPQDEVAKWYLFACEERLGNTKANEGGYGLFMED